MATVSVRKFLPVATLSFLRWEGERGRKAILLLSVFPNERQWLLRVIEGKDGSVSLKNTIVLSKLSVNITIERNISNSPVQIEIEYWPYLLTE